jgi:hypothetical protein
LESCDWLAKAFSNCFVTFPNRTGEQRVVQGMPSGCRATSFINTDLNRAYTDVAVEQIKNTFGVTAINELFFEIPFEGVIKFMITFKSNVEPSGMFHLFDFEAVEVPAFRF